MRSTARVFPDNAHRAMADVKLQRRSPASARAFRSSGAAPSTGCRSSRRSATPARRSRTTPSSTSTSTSSASKPRWSKPAARCTGAPTPRRRAQTVLAICREVRRAHGHQGQVDDRRGNRHQRVPREEQHQAGRDRSRRIHHPAPPRAAEPHHRAGDAPLEGAGGRRLPPASHPVSGRTGRWRNRGSCSTRPGRCCARTFIAADVGITGANMLIAETGSIVLVTNEGNGDLTQTLPRGADRHRLASRRSVPTLEDAADHPAPAGALGDRPGAVRLHDLHHRADAGRATSTARRPSTSCCSTTAAAAMLGNEFREMLRCIRCGACINHCPVYGAIGGHAYGWVYSGPMGAVLIPNLIGIEEAGHLPNASTLCGRCEEVCPMRIPLPRMLRQLRERQFEAQADRQADALGAVGWALPRPPAEALRPGDAASASAPGPARAKARPLPLAAAGRRLDRGARSAAPHGRTFQAMWSAKGGRRQ